MGLFDVFEDIGNTLVEGAKASVKVFLAPVDMVKDTIKIIKGENVLDTLKDGLFGQLKNNIKSLATPIKVIHNISDPLGITDEVDLLVGFVPVVGQVLEASQFAETAEQLIEMKEMMDKMENEFNDKIRKLDEWMKEQLAKPAVKKAPAQYAEVGRKTINEWATDWIEDNADNEDAESIKDLSKDDKAELEDALLEHFKHPKNALDIAFAMGGAKSVEKLLQDHIDDAMKGLQTFRSESVDSRRKRYNRVKKTIFAQKDYILKAYMKQNNIKAYGSEFNKKDDELMKQAWKKIKKASSALGL